ncbi:MAG: SDR family oxidoreductase [Thermoflexales bacterium]|nr:SDR family oxidoreductase [Thermoflexales bacterium]MDW8351669.1 SDR family oxidoreductase [Anaerolineae bacterium]
MTHRVQDKVVIVTGAAQGIGFGIAEMLAREGARVVIADKQTEKGEAAAARIRDAGGEALFQYADVTVEADCAALAQAAAEHFGRLDGLVNNVGWFPRATLEETTTELWEAIMNVNVRSAFYCCKYVIPIMQRGGGGSIVNIGSIHGLQASSNLIAYGAAKGALLNLTRTLAGAYGADRIRCNYLIPGWVMSEGEIALAKSRGVDVNELRAQGAQLLFGRHQTPQDAAYAVVYLISDESSQVTGSIFHIDAGMSTLLFRGRSD